MTMTADELAQRRAQKLLLDIMDKELPAKAHIVVATIRAAEQEARAALMEEFRLAEKQALAAAKADAEQRGAERAAAIIDLEAAAAHERKDSRLASELIRCSGAIRARAKQTETA